MTHYTPTPLTLRVAHRVKLWRQMSNLRLEQAAELLNLSPYTLSTLETAKKSPTLDTLDKISAGMGLSPEDLLRERKVPDPKAEYRDVMFQTLELLQAAGGNVKRAFEIYRNNRKGAQ